MDHKGMFMGPILEVLDLVNCQLKVDLMEATLARN